jgi:predicted metalloprotease with PDZ domain
MRTSLLALLALISSSTLLAETRPILVDVDARDVKKGVFHAHVVLPAKPGAATFTYPEWIPGEHGPSGPIQELVNLRFSSGGRAVPWTRDHVEMFTFHVTVPAGAASIEADFDYLSAPESFGPGYGTGPCATEHLADVLWNQLVLVPGGASSDSLTYEATLQLPAGWSFDTALPISTNAKKDAGVVKFAPVTLTRLVDSPVLAGDQVKTFPITTGEAPVRLAIAADDPKDLEVPEERLAQLRRVVAEANALYGARHYTQYVWLVFLSDVFEPNGLEHPESSDNRFAVGSFRDHALAYAELRTLAHEYSHSWNGKYRRPKGLATGDYEKPMDGELLWVYEGLNRYLGDVVIAPRAGMMSEEEAREYLAWIASSLEDARPGRAWRPLADTAVAAQLTYAAPGFWFGARRGVDFYDESALIWLEADMTIRKETKGARSIDDFCKRFHGGTSGGPAIVPYTLDDVLAALNAVAPHDWKRFFEERVYAVAPHAPFGGLAASGWKLAYDATPNAFRAARAVARKETDWSHPLGLRLDKDGKVLDVLPGKPAFAAGVIPGAKVTAVNGVKLSDSELRGALAKGASGTPIELLLEKDGRFTTVRVECRAGALEPHLVRVDGAPDTLAAIHAAHAK